MIQTKDLYSKKHECCGCESCVSSCPKGIIEMKEDFDGFLYPVAVNPEGCIDCRRCIKVCPLKKPFHSSNEIENYGGYSNDTDEIKKSASGAFASVLAKKIISMGGVVYGVGYSQDFSQAEYKRCTTVEQLEALRGSKYCQARKGNIYSEIKSDLKERKVLFIGLACDVHAVKIQFPSSANLYTVALICHGPTSNLVQREYVGNLMKQSQLPLKAFTVRGKLKGWKPYYIIAEYADGSVRSETFLDSSYGTAFAELKRPSCSKCQFKLNKGGNSIDADLIIGDFHFASPGKVYYNPWGSSQISSLTPKGRTLLDLIKDDFHLYPVSLRTAVHYNRALGKIIKPHWNRNQFAHTLAKKGLIKACELKSVKFIRCYDHCRIKVTKLLVKILHAAKKRK